MKVVLQHLTKRFPNRNKKAGGDVVAVHDFTFEIPDGKLIGLLGPSGCGKSTALNLISGLLEPSEGQIFFGEDDVTHLPPENRGVGLVFQNYALYPHLTVRQNIMFPLENLRGADKLTKAEMAERVLDAAKLVQMEGLMDRKPSELSGGQQQRVAIARAIASEPHLLLMDEPLSNLDAKLRVDMRSELKRLHTETGTTMIYVTHDQVEALTMSTKIAIFREGIIIQVAHPLELYNNPANLYVADFIGNPRINFVDGKAEVSASGLTVNSVLGRMTFPADHLKDENMPQEASFDAVLGIRPEQIAINTSRQSPSDIEAHIYTSMPAGSETLVTVKVGGVSMVIKALGITHYNPDQVVYLSIDTTKINAFDKKTENLIKYSVE